MHIKSIVLIITTVLCTMIASEVSSQELGLHIVSDQDVLFGDSTTNEGSRFMWIDEKQALRAGNIFSSCATCWDIDSLGQGSVAFGTNTIASGVRSVAWGVGTLASAFDCTAWGLNSTASFDGSTAWGGNTLAEGQYSTSWGFRAKSSGLLTTAWGHSTIAPSAFETVFGSYNTEYVPMSTFSLNPNDRLLVVGNGTSLLRSDALVLLKRGFLGLGVSEPESLLHLSNGLTGDSTGIRISNDTLHAFMYHDSMGSFIIRKENRDNQFVLKDNGNIGINVANPVGQFTIKQSTGANNSGLRLVSNGDNASWEIRNTGGSDNLRIRAFANDGTLDHTIEIRRSDGAYLMNSDLRLKKDIEYMDHTLPDVLRINPAFYNWKKGSSQQQKSLGVIAQELEAIFPTAVHTNEDGYKMVNYDALGVLAIQAIKEQEVKINEQRSEINQLNAESEILNQRLSEVEALFRKLNQRFDNLK